MMPHPGRNGSPAILFPDNIPHHKVRRYPHLCIWSFPDHKMPPGPSAKQFLSFSYPAPNSGKAQLQNGKNPSYNTQEAVAKIIKITLENIRQVETKNGGVNNLILL